MTDRFAEAIAQGGHDELFSLLERTGFTESEEIALKIAVRDSELPVTSDLVSLRSIGLATSMAWAGVPGADSVRDVINEGLGAGRRRLTPGLIVGGREFSAFELS